MFGLSDAKDNKHEEDVANDAVASAPNPMPSQLDSDLTSGGIAGSSPFSLPTTPAPSVPATPASAPAMPASDEIKDPELEKAINNATSQLEGAGDDPGLSSSFDGIADAEIVQTSTLPTPPPTIKPSPSASSSVSSITPPPDDLLKIKQEALSDLTPLVDHLDQTPEERFKTNMMLIQASDNSSLIQAAYDAAGKIEDEKIRAQALLDVVNEINYFTQAATEGKEEKS